MKINKKKPLHLKNFIIHSNIANNLLSFEINNLTNIIFYGPTGSGKSTLLYALIRHLFNIEEIKKDYRKLQLPSTEIMYMDCVNFLEISPSDYKLQDRVVITEFIKEIASTRSVKSFFKKEDTPRYKIVVMNSIELMTESAMAALRRTVEQHANNIRIIMITNDISKIIKPIRSRAYCIFVPSPSDIEISELLKKIEEENNLNCNTKELNKIIEFGEGNLHKIFYNFELYLNINNSENKRIKAPLIDIRMDYEKDLDEICIKVLKTSTAQTILACRKLFYYLLSNQVNSKTILNRMLENFLNIGKEKEVLNLFSKYKKRLDDTNKEIIHLEAFILGIMCLFEK